MENDSESASEPRVDRFEPGDHLRVRRPWGYMHHGVYIGNDRVVQFGGRIVDKPRATMGFASLSEFEKSGVAEVVIHGRPRRFLPTLPDALPREEIVERAEWLVHNYLPKRYHAIGNNCEHMANWCTTGWYTESHQVRKGFGLLAALSAAGLFFMSYKQRKSMPVPTGVRVGLVGLSVCGFVSITLYNEHIRRFWRDIGHGWDERKPRQLNEN